VFLLICFLSGTKADANEGMDALSFIRKGKESSLSLSLLLLPLPDLLVVLDLLLFSMILLNVSFSPFSPSYFSSSLPLPGSVMNTPPANDAVDALSFIRKG
jgi:hypothetical protein